MWLTVAVTALLARAPLQSCHELTDLKQAIHRQAELGHGELREEPDQGEDVTAWTPASVPQGRFVGVWIHDNSCERAIARHASPSFGLAEFEGCQWLLVAAYDSDLIVFVSGRKLAPTSSEVAAVVGLPFASRLDARDGAVTAAAKDVPVFFKGPPVHQRAAFAETPCPGTDPAFRTSAAVALCGVVLRHGFDAQPEVIQESPSGDTLVDVAGFPVGGRVGGNTVWRVYDRKRNQTAYLQVNQEDSPRFAGRCVLGRTFILNLDSQALRRGDFNDSQRCE